MKDTKIILYMYYIKNNKIMYIYILYVRYQNPLYMYYIKDNKILYICIT